MGKPGRISILLIMVLLCGTLCNAQKVRYFKAEHGVAATYVKLGADGRYKVIDREHMGILLTDEGRWQQTGAVITFSPADPKNPPYQVTENQYKGKVFLAITSADAAAGIVIDEKIRRGTLIPTPRTCPTMCSSKSRPGHIAPKRRKPIRFATSENSLDDQESAHWTIDRQFTH
jgi:hypothetical protein